jgi:ATP-dependent RNA helicase DDX27
VKQSRDQGAKVVSRQVPVEETDRWMKKLKDLEDEIEEVLKEEKEERTLSITERDLKRGINMIEHEDEIKSRPRRVWFETEKEKAAEREKGAASLNASAGGSVKSKKKKLSGKDKKKMDAFDERKEGKIWKKSKEDRGMGTNEAKEKKAHAKSKSKKISKFHKK